MKRLLLATGLAIFAVFVLPTLARAEMSLSSQHQKVVQDDGTPITAVGTGYQQVTGLTVVKTLTVPADAKYGYVICTGQNVRYRYDGTDPSATVGMLMKTTDPPLRMNREQLLAVEFFQTAATAIVDVVYFK